MIGEVDPFQGTDLSRARLLLAEFNELALAATIAPDSVWKAFLGAEADRAWDEWARLDPNYHQLMAWDETHA